MVPSSAMMGKSIGALALRHTDVVVQPIFPDRGSADFSARRRSIAAGRAAMLAAKPAYKARLTIMMQ